MDIAIESAAPHTKPSKRDPRWTGVLLLPVTILLWLCAITSIGLSAWLLTIYSYLTSYLTISFSIITFIHTTVDFAIYFAGHLQPVYVLSLSSIQTAGYLATLILGAIELTFSGSSYGTCGSGYYGSYYGYERDGMFKSGCHAVKAQISFVAIMFVLYVISIALSAIAHRRYRASKKADFHRLQALAHQLQLQQQQQQQHQQQQQQPPTLYIASCTNCASRTAVVPAPQPVMFMPANPVQMQHPQFTQLVAQSLERPGERDGQAPERYT